MEFVKFCVNGTKLYFRETADIVKTILEDDEYAFIYIKRAQDSGKLRSFGLPPNIPVEEFSRCTVRAPCISKDLAPNSPFVGPVKASCFDSPTISSNSVWTDKKPTQTDIEATNSLIAIRFKEEIKQLFNDPKMPRMTIWEKIANMMKDLGFNLGEYSADRCRQKYLKLRRTYASYKSNVKLGKVDPLKPIPMFMDKMELFCGNKQNISKGTKRKHSESISSTNNENDDKFDHDYFESYSAENNLGILNETYSEDNENITIKTLVDLQKKQINLQIQQHNELMNILKQQSEERRQCNRLLERILAASSIEQNLDSDEADNI